MRSPACSQGARIREANKSFHINRPASYKGLESCTSKNGKLKIVCVDSPK